MAAEAALGFPFTSSQRKELERQAMIYMYMVSSVPVPSYLLLPIDSTRSATDESDPTASLGNGSNIFNLNLLFCNKTDPEPGRCKRTDGKKWRCSRDVAPNQKYCERHLHRIRSRSRKPVEVPSNSNSNTNKKKTRLHHHTLPPTPTCISSPQLLGSTIQPNQIFPFYIDDDRPDESLSVSPYEEPKRGLDWTMEAEMLTMDASEQQWQHLLQTNIGLTMDGSVFKQDCIEEPLNLIAYTDFGAPEVNRQNSESTLFLKPDMLCLGKQPLMETETPRGFIDAWSNEEPNINHKNESSVSSQGNLSPSSLTLSMAMAAGNALDEEMGLIQMALGVTESYQQEPQVSSWVSVGSTPGGPLAEILRQSSIAVSSNPTFPYAFNGNSYCSPATRVSSPSGVLERTMLTPSDSSGCTSLSIAASTGNPRHHAFPVAKLESSLN